MTAIHRRARSCLTDAARTAAVARRRELASIPWDAIAPEIFMLRLAPASKAFTWEVRRFSGVILWRADTLQSYSVGVRALAALAPP